MTVEALRPAADQLDLGAVASALGRPDPGIRA